MCSSDLFGAVDPINREMIQNEFFEMQRALNKTVIMVSHDIAEAVGMHESTISRVTTQKFMHTPRGIYEIGRAHV